MRQEEIYGREEDLESTRAELDRLSQEAQALQTTITQHEQSRQELAARWEQLQAKEQLIAQQQSLNGGALNEQQVMEIRAALHQLGNARSLDPQQMRTTATAIEVQQELLDRHCAQLQQQQQSIVVTTAELDRQQHEIEQRKQQRQELQTSLEKTQTAWEVQQHTLSMQQEYAQRMTVRIQLEQENYQKVYLMSKGGGVDIGESQKLNLEQLEAMPISELEAIVLGLQTEVDRSVQFVHLEEEELQEKQQAIDELCQAISTANEFDKLKLEADLADEQDGYNMLDRTLDGQRQTMRERQTFLQIHNRVLRQRQGHPPAAADRSQVEWESVLRLLDSQRQQQQSELTQIETEIHNLRETISQTKTKIEQQVEAYIHNSKQVQELEHQHQTTKQVSTELVAKIALYQEMIQPLQEHINAFKQQLASLADAAEHQPESQEAMQHIESLLNNLVHGTPI